MKKRSDYERVLMNIAIDTAGTVHDTFKRLNNGWQLRFSFNEPSPQFIPLVLAEYINMPLKRGDVVRCKTNAYHHWGISIFLEKLGHSEWLLQKIGEKAQLRMSNEDLDVLRFINPSHLYTGKQYQIYIWASKKAFSKRYNKNASYWKRCGGIEFGNENLLTIWSRPHIWNMQGKDKNGKLTYAQPKKFTMQWGEKTRLKDIIENMNKQGFDSEFVYSTEKPTEGQAGYMSINKNDIINILNNNN